MNCKYCQRDISEVSSFCPFCGAPQRIPSGSASIPNKRLMRSQTDRKIAGVCGGMAEYFNMDSTIVRLIWALLVILPVPLVPAFIGYFVAWIVMPKGPLYAPAAPDRPPIVIPNSGSTA